MRSVVAGLPALMGFGVIWEMVGGGVPAPICARQTVVSSINQRVPSGPVVMPYDLLKKSGTGVVMGNSVIVPAVVTRPNCPSPEVVHKVNHKFPSGPAVIPPRAA